MLGALLPGRKAKNRHKRAEDAADVALETLRKLGNGMDPTSPLAQVQIPPVEAEAEINHCETKASGEIRARRKAPSAIAQETVQPRRIRKADVAREELPAPMEAPRRVAIHTVPMMSAAEMDLYVWLVDKLEVEAPMLSVHSKVAMEAFLHVDTRAPERDQASTRKSYCQKRVDFLIVDETGLPILAIEYHSPGHFKTNSEASDAAKALALEEAGVPLLVAPQTKSPEAIWAEMEPILEFELGD